MRSKKVLKKVLEGEKQLTTEKSLEAITDRGKFESLVTSILRRSNKDYAAIINTGINTQGEPIKSPVDGFCRVVDSSPPHFVMVQATTTEKRNLKRKWLYDHINVKNGKSISAKDDGDLVKAGRLAKLIRKEFPDAEFTIVLATNQRVDANTQLAVHKKAKEVKVISEIWEQSRLVDFLDNTTEGHWLRRQYLGIEAKLLSESLLRNICEQSLVSYKKEFITNPDNCILREIDKNIEEGLKTNRYTIGFLVGESGFGKSIAAHRLLQKHLALGGYGLWIQPEFIRDGVSLENSIDKVLRAHYPNLVPDAGRTALQLLQKGSQFLIIVDDINRTDVPPKLIHKLLSYSKPQETETPDSQPSFSPCLIVCPLWPNAWEGIDDISKAPWIHTVFIGQMTSVEAEKAVHNATSQAGVEITNTEVNILAAKMGNDPILIGLFGLLIPNLKPRDLNMLAEDVIEKFITSGVKEVASVPGASYLSTEYRDALFSISFNMLIKRKFHPPWKEIESWLKEAPDKLNALRELIRHGKLCRLTDQGEFVFRHDRIQETLLIECMISMLADYTRNFDILGEPFYAEIIGQAFIRSPQNLELLKEIRNRNPLALVEAIHCFGTPTSDYHHAVIEEVKEWTKNNIATGSVPNSVIDAVCWSLVKTDSPAVLEITKSFPPYRLVLLARLRNGCAKSGALYCRIGIDFAPMVNDSLRDQVIEYAKMRHKEQLVRDLKRLLSSSTVTDEEREGALTLAGFLGFSELQDEIASCWEHVTDKTRVLPEAIWAATRCCGSEPNRLLDPLMRCWSSFPDEKDSSGMSKKTWVAEGLRFALRRGIKNNVINYLVSQCDVYESLRFLILLMCDRIDTPDAIEFVVRGAADEERKLSNTGGFSFWTLRLADNWNPSHGGGRKLSQISLDRLKDLWEDPKNDTFLKKQAFRLWLTGVEWEQIDILRTIPADSSLSRSALWKRAQLGDYTVIPNLIQFLSTDAYWFKVAHYIWRDELRIVAERYLESFDIPKDFSGGRQDVHYHLAELLMKIPSDDAELLLSKYWSRLGYSPLFIQTALYVGNPKCLELAALSISQCPAHTYIFEHLSLHFGFFDIEKEKYLTLKHLDNLLPYLNHLDQLELLNIAQLCERIGIPKWGQKNLSNRLDEEHKKRFYPSDDDLRRDLDEFVMDRHGIWKIGHWFDKFDKRHDPKSRVLHIIDHWLASHPTVEYLKIAAECIRVIGTRKDLSILDKYSIEGPIAEITNIKASAQFFVSRKSLE